MTRRKRHAASDSTIPEAILQTLRSEQERASAERAVADFYSSLSDEEVSEHAQWGEFALQEIR